MKICMHTPSQSEDDIFLKSSNAFWSSISNEMLIHVYINNKTQKLVSWLYFLLILLVSQHLIWYVKPYVICKFMALTWRTCQLKEPGKFEMRVGDPKVVYLWIYYGIPNCHVDIRRSARSEVILFVARNFNFS